MLGVLQCKYQPPLSRHSAATRKRHLSLGINDLWHTNTHNRHNRHSMAKAQGGAGNPRALQGAYEGPVEGCGGVTAEVG